MIVDNGASMSYTIVDGNGGKEMSEKDDTEPTKEQVEMANVLGISVEYFIDKEKLYDVNELEFGTRQQLIKKFSGWIGRKYSDKEEGVNNMSEKYVDLNQEEKDRLKDEIFMLASRIMEVIDNEDTIKGLTALSMAVATVFKKGVASSSISDNLWLFLESFKESVSLFVME